MLLHPFIYRILKLTYSMDVGIIDLAGPMISEMGTRSLRQSIWQRREIGTWL